MSNREPQPSDGTDYHAEHSFWVTRQAMLAEAWDAGHRTCRLDPDSIEFNPYRPVPDEPKTTATRPGIGG